MLLVRAEERRFVLRQGLEEGGVGGSGGEGGHGSCVGSIGHRAALVVSLTLAEAEVVRPDVQQDHGTVWSLGRAVTAQNR